MRARKKKHGSERLAAVSDMFTEKAEQDMSKKTYLEIGCGKGKFIIENAIKNPDINYIAVEKVADVILLAAEKAKANEIKNIKFMLCDAEKLTEIFPIGSIDRIYLNFSDPWPKSRHFKRRLTYKTFLDIYKYLLAEGGRICFKTDNIGLFEFSLEQLEADGWQLENVTRDLHNSEFANDNIMTEYEKNFSEKGFKINRLEAYLK